ncbi:glutamine synthetase [Streptomyces sp. SID13666]|uniref:glutamine synthetase family protein n=1 Tax=unclassified Streptomyces TaxID=2593676 RepID=UPI0013BF0134|nr:MULTISPECIES: glutamine synthetase family protein [unclassified Streptomyces]NEA56626.1 glutamine synthetase [Streptomyces sp. SID13666]NEA73070.1 glutamine synthetase [Streptomyces sp. SID13588]
MAGTTARTGPASRPDLLPQTAGGRRPTGQLTLTQLHDHVASGRIDTVLLALPDLQGRLKGKRYHARHFIDRVAEGGAEVCAYVLATDITMTPVEGFELASWQTGYQDLRVIPDPSTVRVLPWMPGTALVLADAVDPDGQPVEVSPRRMLRRQLARLASYGLHVKTGLESEFVLYQGNYAQAAASGHHDLQPITPENLDYALDHDPGTDRFFRRLQAALAGAGLPVEAIKTEGAAGQVEVTFPYGDALSACDGHLVFKHAVRLMGQRAGMAPTFMAAPATGTASGLHLHVSLWTDGNAVLAGSDGNLSPLAEQAITGLLDALPALAPLYAPNANSYKRFAPRSFAPTRFTWGIDNRTCAVRVVGHGDGLHLEIRLPGADANPYLALAAALAGITHGLDHERKPPPACTGNAYDATDAPPVPTTLDRAVTAFRHSPVAQRAFGADVVEHYARLGQIEAAAHRFAVTDTDRHRWFTRA